MMRVVEWHDGPAWDAYVRRQPDSTVMHLYGWKRAVERAYGHRTYFLAATEDGTIRGVLPLVLLSSRLAGRHLVSMPFMDYGGPCTGAADDDAVHALLDRAVAIAREEDAVLSLRCRGPRPVSLPVSLDQVTMLFDLGEDEDALWRRLSGERRNRIRKGHKLGLETAMHGLDGLDDFYRVWSTNMRDLGTPVHAIRFFREILTELGDHARVVLVRWRDEPIGAGLMLLYGDTVALPWISALRPHFAKAPNPVLYWDAMRFALARRYRVFDFGRSEVGSGTFEAKRQWGAEPEQLHWYYYPESAVPPHVSVGRHRWATRVWQRLPLPVANGIGPHLRRGLPN